MNLLPGSANAELGVSAGTHSTCGVCWWVSEPLLGDPVAGIRLGTPVTSLPVQWRRPERAAPTAPRMAVAG